jgi:hypothetical protein
MKIYPPLLTRFFKGFLPVPIGIPFFCFLLCCFCIEELTAQETDTVSRIVLSYNIGGSSWGNPGIYSRGEVMELVPDGRGNFVYSYYIKKTASAGKDGNTFSKDSVMVSVVKFKPVSAAVITEWLTELKTDRNNLTVGYLLPLLDKPAKKQMKRVAETIGRSEEFEKSDYNEGEEMRKLVANLRNFKGLDHCLEKMMADGRNSLIVIDAFDSLMITVYSENNKTVYHSQFFDPLGQPVHRSFNGNYLSQTPVVNLDANVAARRFLPKDSLIYNVLDLNTFTDYYIAWYLEYGYDIEGP